MPVASLRTPATVIVTSAVAIASLGAAATGATAQEPTCVATDGGGEAALVVTKDTTLDHDISSGCEAGIEVGAPGITLDLAGHRVAGRDYGIRNRGQDHVAIQNGRVAADVAALELVGAEQNLVRSLTARTDLGSAIRLTDSDRNRVVLCDSGGYLEGIGLHDGSDGNVVEHNNEHGSVGGGLRVDDSGHNRIVGNVISFGLPTGLRLSNAHHNLVARNRVLVESSDGIRLDASHFNILSRNRVADQHPLEADTPPSGITISASRGNRVTRNAVEDAVVGLQLLGGARNLFGYNRAASNDRDGVLVDASSVRSLLFGNRATGNGDDGLDVESPSTRLIANRARRNGDLGIEAVAGVFARANRAAGNGNAAQCLNVRCR